MQDSARKPAPKPQPEAGRPASPDGAAHRPTTGNIIFRSLMISTLALIVLFLGAVLVSIVSTLTWSDFATSIKDPTSIHALKLTAKYVTTALIASVIVALPASYALSRYRVPFASLVDTIIDLPLVLPPLIAGISLLVFFQTAIGRWIEAHVAEFVYKPPGVVLAIFFPTVSLGIRAMKAAFDAVDPRYEQVARTLGCTEFQAFWKVTVPLARNGLIAGVVLTWARSLGVFGSIIMFAGATLEKTGVIPVAIFLNMTTGRITTGISLTALLLAIAVASLYAFKKLGGRATIA